MASLWYEWRVWKRYTTGVPQERFQRERYFTEAGCDRVSVVLFSRDTVITFFVNSVASFASIFCGLRYCSGVQIVMVE